MDELKLYEKMKAGDQSAFDQIFKLYYEYLVKFAYSKINDISTSEDLVQSVFIDFWTKKNMISLENSILAYLKKMVQNRCIDYFRKQKSIQKKELQFFQNSLSLDISSPEEDLLSKENLEAIFSKIEALPPKCKIVFKLSRFEDMTYAEIATHLGISKKTVELHISTALRILRKTIFLALVFFFL